MRIFFKFYSHFLPFSLFISHYYLLSASAVAFAFSDWNIIQIFIRCIYVGFFAFLILLYFLAQFSFC